MRVPFRLRDLRDPQHLEIFLDIWRRYLDEFHSPEFAGDGTADSEDAESFEDKVMPTALYGVSAADDSDMSRR